MSTKENCVSAVQDLSSNDENNVVSVEQKDKVTNKGIISSSTQRRLKQPLVTKTNIMIEGEESTSSVEGGRRAATTALVYEHAHGLDMDLEHQSPIDSKEVAQKVENERQSTSPEKSYHLAKDATQYYIHHHTQIDKEIISAVDQQTRETQEKQHDKLAKKFEELTTENKAKKEELATIQDQIKTFNKANEEESMEENDIKSRIDQLKSQIHERQNDLKELNTLLDDANEKGLKHEEDMDKLDDDIEEALNELAVVKFKISEYEEVATSAN